MRPPGTADGRVRLVEQEERASRSCLAAQLVVEAGLRLYDAEVRERGLCYHARDVARLERRPESSRGR